MSEKLMGCDIRVVDSNALKHATDAEHEELGSSKFSVNHSASLDGIALKFVEIRLKRGKRIRRDEESNFSGKKKQRLNDDRADDHVAATATAATAGAGAGGGTATAAAAGGAGAADDDMDIA